MRVEGVLPVQGSGVGIDPGVGGVLAVDRALALSLGDAEERLVVAAIAGMGVDGQAQGVAVCVQQDAFQAKAVTVASVLAGHAQFGFAVDRQPVKQLLAEGKVGDGCAVDIAHTSELVAARAGSAVLLLAAHVVIDRRAGAEATVGLKLQAHAASGVGEQRSVLDAEHRQYERTVAVSTHVARRDTHAKAQGNGGFFGCRAGVGRLSLGRERAAQQRDGAQQNVVGRGGGEVHGQALCAKEDSSAPADARHNTSL